MTVISITLTESVEQIVSGIPRFVSVSTNIPATIFYTIDGTAPTLYSTIYTSTIELPTKYFTINLQLFATNGPITSDIVSEIYQTVQTGKNLRLPYSGTDATPNSTQGLNDPYPFGTNPIMPGQIFLGPQEANLTVDNPLLPRTSSGYDGFGNEAGFTNEPLIGIATITQPIIFSETNAQGETGNGIGTLPRSTVKVEPAPPQQQEYNSDQLFDPRALVVFQDFTKPNDPDKPVFVNRQFFSLENAEKDNGGNAYFNAGLDNPGFTGSFVRQHFNPADQTLTYYYRDASSNRWIISKTPYKPAETDGKLYNIAFSSKPGARFIFQWIYNKASYLY